MKLNLPYPPLFCDECGSLRLFGCDCDNCNGENEMPEPKGSIVKTFHDGYNGLIHESDVRRNER